jgi:hypothetical protein
VAVRKDLHGEGEALVRLDHLFLQLFQERVWVARSGGAARRG